jgi:hypothetical protein
MRFHAGYAVAALLVFAIEVAIALFVRDGFVRPYGGDVLAVVLVYLGLRAVTRIGVIPAAATAFAIAVLVELSQWIGLVRLIGLGDSAVARTVLGTGFDWGDFAAYAAGAILALAEGLRKPAGRAFS